MSAPLNRRTHLVERAAEMLGGPGTPMAAPPPAIAPERAAERPGPERPAPAPAAAPAAPPPPVISRATLVEAGLIHSPDGPQRSRRWEEMTIVQHQVVRTIKDAASGLGPRGRIVLVTSAMPNEGKTFTSLNLAASIAISSTRHVVLVDADGRLGGISHTLGVPTEMGLRALAQDVGNRRAATPLPTAIERLHILPYGASLPGQPDLPSGASMAAAVLRLAGSLPDHIVVLDTPPCLSTSEPTALAAVAGQVVLVVDAERTQRNEVEAALDMIDACPVLQLLLNRVRLTANDTFGAYGNYEAPHDT
ncbi:hypothetical protein ACQW02_25950 [Humitalea sp. 24SJ18S-53]|uniref:hypothetical protein n=1 Tax=Humitalea sp. 24SJ18S-53 TaxID=3422307 RepID=UPI003D67B85F